MDCAIETLFAFLSWESFLNMMESFEISVRGRDNEGAFLPISGKPEMVFWDEAARTVWALY